MTRLCEKLYDLLDDPDEIFTFPQWAALNKISQRTGRRIISSPGGPEITMLSKQRIGISRRANRVWQESKTKRA